MFYYFVIFSVDVENLFHASHVTTNKTPELVLQASQQLCSLCPGKDHTARDAGIQRDAAGATRH